MASGAPESALGGCRGRWERQCPNALQTGARPYPGVETDGARPSSSGVRMDTEEASAMPLLQRIGEIFLANETAQAREDFSTSLERFLVPDRGTDRNGLSVVLLVESPHTDEVGPCEIVNRYPLAGHTGQYVRGKLREWIPGLNLPGQHSIGWLVHEGHPSVQTLGIMNVSWLPFLSDAYTYDCIPDRGAGDCRHLPAWPNYEAHMRTIKRGPCVPAVNRRIAECRELDRAITTDLRRRLVTLHRNHPAALLVRCGPVAKAFYEKAVTCDLPHPSHSNWQTFSQRQEQCLQTIIDRLRPRQPGA